MASPVAKRILVVEDEDAIRETLRYNLAREGYHVLEAATGPDALNVARAERPARYLVCTGAGAAPAFLRRTLEPPGMADALLHFRREPPWRNW